MIDSVKLLFMKFYFPFFFLLMSLTSYSQNEINFDSIELKRLLYTEEVLEEASFKNIKKDKTLVIFNLDDNCEISNFQIGKPSLIDSFNQSIIKNKEKIIEFIKRNLDCNKIYKGKCAIPFYFIID